MGSQRDRQLYTPMYQDMWSFCSIGVRDRENSWEDTNSVVHKTG